jgi:phosphate transport system substrate-binding protein
LPRDASYLTVDGRIRIVGYNDMAEMLEQLAHRFTAAHPQFQFALDLNGTRTAPPALIAGQSLFAPMGAEFSDANLADYRRAMGADPLMVRIAHASLSPAARSSPLGFIVHRDNPLASISMDTARRIFTGRQGRPAIRSWRQLGLGPAWGSRPIEPTGLEERLALGLYMRNHKFGGRGFAANFVGKSQSRDVVAHVARHRNAIGFSNLSHANATVRVVPVAEHGMGPFLAGTEQDIRSGHYPLDRHLLIYAARRNDGTIDPVAHEWLQLVLSCDGQQAIAGGTLGYLPLNAAELDRERRKLRN